MMQLLGWGVKSWGLIGGACLTGTGQAAAMRSDLRDCEHSTKLSGCPRRRPGRGGRILHPLFSQPLLKSQGDTAPLEGDSLVH